MNRRPPAVNIRWLPNYLKVFGTQQGMLLFWRIFRFDRADRRVPVPVIVPELGEVWLRAVTRDHAIFQQIWVKREYDLAVAAPHHFRKLMDTYSAILARGTKPLILDAGAHVGMSVLWWRRLFPKALIVAVEPSSENLAILRKNVAGLNDVIVLAAALAGELGSLRIMDTAASGAAVRVGREGTGHIVPAVTVAHVLEQVGASEILLAKIDIEGGEASLFSGDLGWLDHTYALAVETHDWLYPGQGTSKSMFAAIANRRFDFLTSGENTLLFKY